MPAAPSSSDVRRMLDARRRAAPADWVPLSDADHRQRRIYKSALLAAHAATTIQIPCADIISELEAVLWQVDDEQTHRQINAQLDRLRAAQSTGVWVQRVEGFEATGAAGQKLWVCDPDCSVRVNWACGELSDIVEAELEFSLSASDLHLDPCTVELVDVGALCTRDDSR